MQFILLPSAEYSETLSVSVCNTSHCQSIFTSWIYIYVCNITLLSSSSSEQVWLYGMWKNSKQTNLIQFMHTEYKGSNFLSKLSIQSLHLTKGHCHKGKALFCQWKAILLLCNCTITVIINSASLRAGRRVPAHREHDTTGRECRRLKIISSPLMLIVLN